MFKWHDDNKQPLKFKYWVYIGVNWMKGVYSVGLSRYSTFQYPDPYQDPCPKILMRKPYSTYQYPLNVSFYLDLTFNCQHNSIIIYRVEFHFYPQNVVIWTLLSKIGAPLQEKDVLDTDYGFVKIIVISPVKKPAKTT